MKIEELNLNQKITDAFNSLGFESLTPVQEKSIPCVLNKSDVVVRSQTGSGKTLAYGIPMLETLFNRLDENPEEFKGQKLPYGLVICPTRELAVQVTAELRRMLENVEGVKIVPIYGGADITRQIKSLKTGTKIVVGTPGRIIDHIERKTLKLHKIEMVVLDEADEMLNMGFKQDIEEILKTIPSQRQTLLFSATFPVAIKGIINTFLTNVETIEIGTANQSLKNIKQLYCNVERTMKKEALIECFKKFSPNKAIVFCNTKSMTNDINEILCNEGINSVALNGDMRQSERKRNMDAMRDGKSTVLVATDVAARGIDINDIDYVFNFDLPNDVEYFIHRIGRTARAGKFGSAITIVNTKMQLDKFLDFAKETNANVEKVELVLSKSVSAYPERRESQRPAGRFGNGSRNGADRNSRAPRAFSDRAPRAFGDRAPRAFGDRPERSESRAPRAYSDRAPRANSDRAPRAYSDRPERSESRAPRAYSDRAPRAFGDRPERSESRAPRAFSDRTPRAFSDRPERSESRAPRAYSDRAPKIYNKSEDARSKPRFDNNKSKSFNSKPDFAEKAKQPGYAPKSRSGFKSKFSK
ncbi:MAG: DEAD/DEAH box helicase [Clostridia bacterium]